MRKEWMQIATVIVWGLLAFSYTLSPALISISFILLSVIGIIQFNPKIFSQLDGVIAILFVLFFLSSAVSYFYSENTGEAVRKLILKLPILCFPLVLMAIKKTEAKQVASMVLIGLYAMYLPAAVSVYNYWSNKRLFDQLILESKPLPIEFGYGIYHIQFSVVLAISVVLGVYMLLNRRRWELSQFKTFTIALFSTINFLFLHILSARTGLLALYIGLLALGLPHFIKMNFRHKLSAFLLCLLIPLLIFTFSSSLRNRLSNSMEDLEVAWTGKDANDYSFAMRVQAWKNAIQVIKQNPMMGVGIGDADAQLKQNFASMNSQITESNRKNPHFQFLETAVQSGLISAALFLAIILFSVIGLSEKNTLLSAIAWLLFIASCFESILERQASVVAFSAFLALALCIGYPRKKENLRL